MKMHKVSTAFLLWLLLSGGSVWSVELNGFDIGGDAAAENSVVRIGPVDYPIEALASMKIEPIDNTAWQAGDFVMGISINGEARAYPLAIMVWHQIVNDELGGMPVLVTFCRTCGTGLVYERSVDSQVLTFGMSGLIYQADVLLYDQQTGSLWSRFVDEAISGPLQGQLLFDLPYQITPLEEWKKRYPESTVVSRDTGFEIDYSFTPDGGPAAGENIFAALPSELRYHADMPALGVSRNGRAKAYPAGEVLVSGGKITDRFDGLELVIEYSPEQQVFTHNIDDSLQVEQTSWEAWATTYPDTAVFAAVSESGSRRLKHSHSGHSN